jgi:hypothetical protein
MNELSNRDAILKLLGKVEKTVIELDRTRTQSDLESYSSAKELLLDAIETVRVGGAIAE